MSGTIFQVDATGGLVRMEPTAPATENRMQELIARYPEVIGVEGDLLLIRREMPIADCEDGGGRWSLDHLFVSREAIPVLVEVKRASDSRLRREIVGQMLDYAANATSFWPAGRLAEAFGFTCSQSGMDAEACLATFLDGRDEESFWEQVEANLKAGRLKLVFVADAIPPELARVVEFLDGQMEADVRAIELGWFETQAGTTALVPRVVGMSERAVAQKKISSSRTLSGERLEGRKEFWSLLFQQCKGRGAGFDRMAPSVRGDMQIGGGVAGANFKFCVTQKDCDVVLYMDRATDASWGKRTLDRLLAEQSNIEADFGGKLVF